MSDLIWFNGKVMNMADAHVGVEDRGFQFADGVYEVVRFYNGRPFTLREHMERLARSAEGIKLAVPMPIEELADEITRFVPHTGEREGYVYLQLTRGVCERNHRFPKTPPPATLLFYVHPLPPALEPGEGEGLKLLAENYPASFAALVADRKGDILVAQNKLAEARTAYENALEKMDARNPGRQLIQLKVDAIGGNSKAAA